MRFGSRSQPTRGEVALMVLFLTAAGVGLLLQITHTARTVGALLGACAVIANSVVILGHASRVNREELDQQAQLRAAQRREQSQQLQGQPAAAVIRSAASDLARGLVDQSSEAGRGGGQQRTKGHAAGGK
jgi:hypothetical protein